MCRVRCFDMRVQRGVDDEHLHREDFLNAYSFCRIFKPLFLLFMDHTVNCCSYNLCCDMEL